MPQLPDLSAFGSILQFFVACIGAYLFAVWIAMIVWTFRDARSRSRDIFTQALSVALVVVFNLPGLLLYLILRPRETLAEKYERELAGEAMLQDIEERQVCPVCHHKVSPDFLVCPNCHTKLHKKCDHCGRVLNLKWNVCPYCGETQGTPVVGRAITTPPAPPAVRLPQRQPTTLPSPETPKALPSSPAQAESQP
ncbi:MAG: zinc ribbon domain-containing protein [Anaerolineae bacterium]|nr:zinc ribbon domain-containing protein [Anaerolineae bacterium]